MKAKGGSWSNKGEEEQDQTVVRRSKRTLEGREFGNPKGEPGIAKGGVRGRRARKRAPRQRWDVLVRWSLPAGWFAGWAS